MGEREIGQARAQAMGMGFVDLDRVRLDPETLALVTPETARELRVLPVKRDGNTLWLAVDTLDTDTIQKVKDATGLRAIPAMCVPSALDGALDRL